ncbi:MULTISPECIES: hypothetical protein [Bacillota]|nr:MULTISPECIES: hypothetical protein [Thomasclavelia]EHO23971.1 hypothetical protein HMPREF0982_03552 [Erysipelotrichaceae bacterium 21_3]CDC87113.1 putative uncharacterized protein [Erysipelotrichaceae bacterium CAG:64]DAJ52404.1 MAG TPA: hypothetical protein [Caudoviricetes sp.]BDE98017.1 hypothetical protein CE91St51_00550 [[Clostridium] innocuum]BDE99240.1 hypothetical protein CE91St51_12780 [[Clostridium] innocuum]
MTNEQINALNESIAKARTTSQLPEKTVSSGSTERCLNYLMAI